MGGWNLLGGLMPPAVDTAGESERRHSRDLGAEEEFEILEREEVKIEERRRSEDLGNESQEEAGVNNSDTESSAVTTLEFQLTQSLLSQIKANENNQGANSGKQAYKDLPRVGFVINGQVIDKNFVSQLRDECNQNDQRQIAKHVFTKMFEHAKAEIPNDNLLEELITSCNQAGYDGSLLMQLSPIFLEHDLQLPDANDRHIEIVCSDQDSLNVKYCPNMPVKQLGKEICRVDAILEFTLKFRDSKVEYENGKVTLAIPEQLENCKAGGKSLLDDINRHFEDADNAIIESLVENIGEGPKSFVLDLPAEVDSDSFDIIPENAVFDLGHIPELIKKAVDDKDVNDLANHIGSFQDHVTHVSPKEGLPVAEKILEIVSGFIEEQGKAWNCHPTVPIASHIYSAKQQYYDGYISQADYEKVANLKEILCKIKSNLIKRSSNDHNAGPSVTNAQDTSAILNETPISSQAVDRKDGNQLNTKESKNQQLQSSIVDKGENIIANKKASKEATINRKGKMPKNTKTIEKKLSDAINSIDLPSVAKLLVPPNNKVNKLILQKSLNQANNKIQSLKESKKKENQERNLKLIIKLLTERLEETVSVGDKADCSSTTKSPVMNSTDSQQPQENVVDKGENIINSEKASKEAIVNNCEESKMPKNTKTTEEKLSDAIDSINCVNVVYLLKKLEDSAYESTVQKLLSQASNKMLSLKEDEQKKDLTKIIALLKNELEHITAALPAGDNVGATASSQQIPVKEVKERESDSSSLSSEDNDFSKLEGDKSDAFAGTSSDSNSNSPFEEINEESYEIRIPIIETVEPEATASTPEMPSMATEEKSGNINDKENDDQQQPADNTSVKSALSIDGDEEEQDSNQSAKCVKQTVNRDTQQETVLPVINKQSSESNQKTTTLDTKKYIVAASALAITGIALGVAVAVYLEMLAIGVAVAACCLIAATITYCYRPKSLVEDNQVKKVMQTEECLSK
ncbi:MAG: hypothetical protein AB3P11_00355 [Wolbachia pipientis]